MFHWPVVPICERQRRDVRTEDLVSGGLYRLCDSSRAGGGYDPLPRIAQNRLGITISPVQFVVQVKGCPLHCPYCYVTPQGVYGRAELVSSQALIEAYRSLSGVGSFHLMGGAPAIYLKYWHELAWDVNLCTEVFHSDLLLMEQPYDAALLRYLFTYNSLYAINIKGTSDEELCMNTQVVWSKAVVEQFWANLDTIVYGGFGGHCYFTFTNCDPDGVQDFIASLNRKYPQYLIKSMLSDYVEIPLKHYDALNDWYQET